MRSYIYDSHPRFDYSSEEFVGLWLIESPEHIELPASDIVLREEESTPPRVGIGERIEDKVNTPVEKRRVNIGSIYLS